jgi:hypothetical protein
MPVIEDATHTPHRERTEDQFAEAVANDVRNHTDPETAAWLRSPEMVNRWYDALVELLRSVDFQFAGQKAETYHRRRILDDKEFREYYDDVLKWRTSTMRFKRAIEKRIADARSLRRQVHGEARGLAYELARAIEEHADPAKENFEEDDEKLWKYLDDPRVERLLAERKDAKLT